MDKLLFYIQINQCMEKQLHIRKIFEVWERRNPIKYSDPIPDINKIIGQIADYFAPGKFYYYIINFGTLKMDYVHTTVKHVLGLEPEEFTLEKYLDIQHDEDIKVFHKKEGIAAEFLFNFINPEDIPHYKVVYVNRVKTAQRKIIKLLHQAKALRVTDDGKIHYVFGVHTDISHMSVAIDHKVSFIGDEGYPSYYSPDLKNIIPEETVDFQNLFSKRELAIIRLVAEGKSTQEIADTLFVALSTIKTHRKNILLKSGARSSTHLMAICMKEGLI